MANDYPICYSKSRVMRRAWEFFEKGTPLKTDDRIVYSCGPGDFIKALHASWGWEKELVFMGRQYAASEGIFPKPTQRELRRRAAAERAAKQSPSDSFMRGAAEWYANAPRGTYFGD